jgi:hypothetical protein
MRNPHSSKRLDHDSHIMNADPKHWILTRQLMTVKGHVAGSVADPE